MMQNKEIGNFSNPRTIMYLFGIFLIFAYVMVIIGSPASAIQIYTAQNDVAFMPEQYANGTCWILPENGLVDESVLDFPSKQIDGLTYCIVDKSYTANVPAGAYNVLYQSPNTINGKEFIDITLRNSTLFSALAYVNPVDISGMNAVMVKEKLEHLILSDHLNNLTIDQIVIEKPLLSITSLGPVSSTQYSVIRSGPDGGSVVPKIVTSPFYRISGKSNLPNGTRITVKVDEDRYYSQHSSAYTYTTTFSRPPNQKDAEWSVDMGFNTNDMPTGWHDISVYAGELESTVRFKTDIQINPTPTPTEYTYYLSNGDIAPVIVNHTITVIQTQYIDRWHTATPTPSITDALGNVVNYPYEPGTAIPPEAGVGCLILIAAIVLLREGKKK